MRDRLDRGARAAQVGLLVNAGLAAVKLVAGIAGNSYALIADAVESTADVFSSLIVWGGLHIASRKADEQYPFGYGKAEPLAAAVVSLLLIGAAIGISVPAAREIAHPQATPAPYTLVVLLVVVAIKELLYRRSRRIGAEVDSTAVRADAWHHRSDAFTSAAAAAGIGIALVGGERWASADEWAALVAAAVIVWGGLTILRPAVADLMDRTPDQAVLERIHQLALGVSGVENIETLKVRRSGMGYFVDIHVEADPEMSLHDAHVLSGMVKSAIRAAMPQVLGVLVHMEPYEPSSPGAAPERA